MYGRCVQYSQRGIEMLKNIVSPDVLGKRKMRKKSETKKNIKT